MVAGGNITTQALQSYSESTGNSGDGGAISLDAGGNINTEILESSSNSSSNSGDGGAISVKTGGHFSTSFFESYSVSNSNKGLSGNGGAIFLNAQTIKFNLHRQPSPISTYSVGANHSGDGGEVNITTNNLSNTKIITLSSYSKSGSVTITVSYTHLRAHET